MNKVAKRLLTFFIGTPIILLIVFCDYLNHLPLQIVLGIFSVLGANEFYTMISKRNKLFTKEIVLIATVLLPFACYIFILSNLPLDITPWLFIAIIILLMGFESFTAKTFENSLSKLAYSTLTIFYCGFLITFISRMTLFPNAKYIISLFLIFVFMCDSCAWFFGILFGKSTRGFAKASPNKSLVGFAGGILGSILAGVLGKIFWNDIFTGSILKIVFLGIAISISSIVGDLAESVFKRSAEIKDSGSIMPGRGGILDSIDSIIMSAPLFYFMTNILYGPFVQ